MPSSAPPLRGPVAAGAGIAARRRLAGELADQVRRPVAFVCAPFGLDAGELAARVARATP
jgi:hypothetical protein